MSLTITILGSADVLPTAGGDTASFLINGRVLVDAGWNAALQMLRFGHDPLAVETLLVTHFHHDHYLGLPHLLFYRAMSRSQAPLSIVGPQSDLSLVIERTREFLQAERFPPVWPPIELVPLVPGEPIEGADFRVETCPSIHPVEGWCGRFMDRGSGVAFAFSGDTAPNTAFASLARGSELMIHEASLAPDASEQNLSSHSRAVDAAHAAASAGVRRLLLIHGRAAHADRSLAAARALFPATDWAREGEKIELPLASYGQKL